MKENELNSIVDNLGGAEQSFIKEHYYSDFLRWAKLIDEVSSFSDILVSLPEGFQNDIKRYIEDYDGILNQLKTLNIAENSAGPDHVKNRHTSFKNSIYLPLIEAKKTLQAASGELTDVRELSKVVSRAKKERQNFEKSFSESLTKQAEGSQRTLATYFKRRLDKLKNDNLTSPQKWIDKRIFWGRFLAGSLIVLVAAYVFFVHEGWIKGYEVQVAIAKLAFLALIYSQYYFATKNYHIYADLVAYYEHLTVISRTLTDFIAAAYEDPSLKESILSNASKTLFSEVKTSHSKQDQSDMPVLENIMNNWPPKTG